MDVNKLNDYFSGSFKFIETDSFRFCEEKYMSRKDVWNKKLPDELEELKLRLQIELDGAINSGTNYQSNLVSCVIHEWYDEYREDYEKLMLSLDDRVAVQSDNKDATHWALQNLS